MYACTHARVRTYVCYMYVYIHARTLSLPAYWGLAPTFRAGCPWSKLPLRATGCIGENRPAPRLSGRESAEWWMDDVWCVCMYVCIVCVCVYFFARQLISTRTHTQILRVKKYLSPHIWRSNRANCVVADTPLRGSWSTHTHTHSHRNILCEKRYLSEVSGRGVCKK